MMRDWNFGYGFGIGPIAMLAFAALLVLPFWRICEKAGYPGVLGLLVLVPVVNVSSSTTSHSPIGRVRGAAIPALAEIRDADA